jgi:hypothetical protein
LIDQGTLYRGNDHKNAVIALKQAKKEFIKLKTESRKDNFCWYTAKDNFACRVKNTVIGTLLEDISADRDLDAAVSSYEQKVAPMNYKRPTALVTKGMVKQAQDKVNELGIAGALQRRYAVSEDLTVNNVIYVDRATRASMKASDPFDSLMEDMKNDVKLNPSTLKKVEEISIDKFISDIVPNVSKVEVMFENRHINNLMSLVAPVDTQAPNIFKWGNNFSWSYNGEVTDSIKERVKKAGGSVTGELLFRLAWFNYDDLDLHLEEPNGNHIYFGNNGKIHRSGGMLDVDANRGGGGTREPVENIFYRTMNRMPEGKYKLYVNQWRQMENKDVGFILEMEYKDETVQYVYDKVVKGNVNVLEFTYSKKTGIEITSSLPSSSRSQDIWNVSTQQFHPVKMIMNSPNFWDGEETGNKHVFFIMEKCLNPESTRGFYNEYLKNELTPHRKVFEVLASKMKTEESNNQLSGLGFSVTQRNSAIFKVSGSFNRTLKVNF